MSVAVASEHTRPASSCCTAAAASWRVSELEPGSDRIRSSESCVRIQKAVTIHVSLCAKYIAVSPSAEHTCYLQGSLAQPTSTYIERPMISSHWMCTERTYLASANVQYTDTIVHSHGCCGAFKKKQFGRCKRKARSDSQDNRTFDEGCA